MAQSDRRVNVAPERAIVSVFGIRGLGSTYYLAYATGKTHFQGSQVVWATVLVIILTSIRVLGVAVTPVMRWVDKARGVDPLKPVEPEAV